MMRGGGLDNWGNTPMKPDAPLREAGQSKSLRRPKCRSLLGSPMISMRCALCFNQNYVASDIEENPIISGFPVWRRSVNEARMLHGDSVSVHTRQPMSQTNVADILGYEKC
jgi:hypothetical protein